jgi:hypothetical protein|tara:strand:+ start:12671 stop:13846 length:1176 start_codon:yes stop_codon:yes gene_type:complete
MKSKKYIILNFPHGNSPYLRTIELAIAVNDIFEKKGIKRLGIIVPWVYEERQRYIIRHNFSKIIKKYPDEILLDKNLGNFLSSIFYDGHNYNNWLKFFLENNKDTEDKIQEYFNNDLTAQNFKGKKISVDRNQIEMEINRCPIIDFKIKPSYYTSFAYYSDILKNSKDADAVKVDNNLLDEGVKYYSGIEKNQTLRFIAEPATFSCMENKSPGHKSEILTPPNTNQKLRNPFFRFIKRGVYCTITGIYGMNQIFNEMHKMHLSVYTHKTGFMPFSKRAPIDVISHKNILMHFARVGWGSAWLSFNTETPLIALPYDSNDEPEVYFNNLSIEKLGIGKIYNGQRIDELLEFGNKYKKTVKTIKADLIKKYGTLNGVEYTAAKIVDHYLKTGA